MGDSWDRCPEHKTVFPRGTQCLKCPKKSTLHEEVVVIRKLLENGVVDKKVLSKINDRMNDHLMVMNEQLKQVAVGLHGIMDGRNKPSRAKEMNISLLVFTERFQLFMKAKQELSSLL